jgi:putative ABC transport system permease protein
MNELRQIAVVLALNLRNLHTRLWPSLVIVVGMACVVGVLLSMLSLTTGLVHAYMASGNPQQAIVLSQTSQFEFGSSISRASIDPIFDAPGISKDRTGAAVAAAEILSSIPVTIKKSGFAANVLLRGFGPKSLEMRPEFKLVSGRMFRPGSREMLAGIAAEGQFNGLNVGDKIILPDGEWPIVGNFSTGGDILEGELVADAPTAMAALRSNTFNSVTVRLANPGALSAFKKALTSNPALSVTAERLSDYYLRTTQLFSGFFNGVAYTVGAIMAIGALFGALNTMYSAVNARMLEIATLRALGFGAVPIAVSVIAEAMLLALVGALIGATIAWLLFNGEQKAMGSNVFNMLVSPGLIVSGVAWALVIALLGSLFPSIRAARLPIAIALRET